MNFSDTMAEAVLSTKKSCLVAHTTHFVAVLKALLKNWKEKPSDAGVLFYAKHTDKFTSLKHSLLVFQVRTNKAQD